MIMATACNQTAVIVIAAGGFTALFPSPLSPEAVDKQDCQ
jgi:hypothetical protein